MKVNNSAINLLVFEKIKFRLFEQQSKSMVLIFFFKWDISFKCFTSILNEKAAYMGLLEILIGKV